MYAANPKEMSEKNFLIGIIDMVREQRQWKHTKCSIKTREGRKDGKSKKIRATNKTKYGRY